MTIGVPLETLQGRTEASIYRSISISSLELKDLQGGGAPGSSIIKYKLSLRGVPVHFSVSIIKSIHERAKCGNTNFIR